MSLIDYIETLQSNRKYSFSENEVLEALQCSRKTLF